MLCFRKVIDIDDDFSDAWVSLGLIAYEMKNMDLAKNCYISALERDDKNPKTWNNLGVLFFNTEKYQEARDCFEKAVAITPLYPDALFNLRDVCRELGDFTAAAEFERAFCAIS